MTEEAPPPYSAGSSSLQVPSTRSHRRTPSGASDSTVDSIDSDRLSMIDAYRDLPDGWIRELDPKTEHFFYVDTKANPPRSIWVHPYDDPEYLSGLPDSDPAFIEASKVGLTEKDKIRAAEAKQGARLTDRSKAEGSSKYWSSRRTKDAVTGTTHDERAKARQEEEERDRAEFEAYKAQKRSAQQNNYQPTYQVPETSYKERSSGLSSLGAGAAGLGAGLGALGLISAVSAASRPRYSYSPFGMGMGGGFGRSPYYGPGGLGGFGSPIIIGGVRRHGGFGGPGFGGRGFGMGGYGGGRRRHC